MKTEKLLDELFLFLLGEHQQQNPQQVQNELGLSQTRRTVHYNLKSGAGITGEIYHIVCFHWFSLTQLCKILYVTVNTLYLQKLHCDDMEAAAQSLYSTTRSRAQVETCVIYSASRSRGTDAVYLHYKQHDLLFTHSICILILA